MDLIFTSALVLILHTVYWNVATCQTLFLLLLFLSLSLRYRKGFSGGAWLALAILVKPFAAVLVLNMVMLRMWRCLAGTIATLLLATLATLLVFGRTVFSAYLAVPFDRLPMSMYTEIENQSVLAWILRITHSHNRFPAAYLILAGLSGLILLWLLNAGKVRNEESWYGLVLIFGLLFYPGSLRSYTVLLSVPILVLIANKARPLPIALACGLTYFNDGNYVVLATLMIGISLAITQMPSFRVEDPGLSYVPSTMFDKVRRGYQNVIRRPTLGPN